jgi:hypothetical protein
MFDRCHWCHKWFFFKSNRDHHEFSSHQINQSVNLGLIELEEKIRATKKQVITKKKELKTVRESEEPVRRNREEDYTPSIIPISFLVSDPSPPAPSWEGGGGSFSGGGATGSWDSSPSSSPSDSGSSYSSSDSSPSSDSSSSSDSFSSAGTDGTSGGV